VVTVVGAATATGVTVAAVVTGAAWAGIVAPSRPAPRALVSRNDAGMTRRRVADSTKETPLDADRVS
jgi:hypothetical protein